MVVAVEGVAPVTVAVDGSHILEVAAEEFDLDTASGNNCSLDILHNTVVASADAAIADGIALSSS